MDTVSRLPYIVTPAPKRGDDCWKLEIRKSFTRKTKIRRFFRGPNAETEAYNEGDRLTDQIRDKGVTSVQAEGTTVAAAIKRFWERRGPQIKGKIHRWHLERNLSEFQKKYERRGIASITPDDLVDFWSRKNWPDGKSTRWQAFTYLRIFFNWLERHDIIEKNPIRRVDPPTQPGPLSEILQPDQMKEMLKNLPLPWEKAYACLSGFAGLRSSECLRVDPERDFNWEHEEIHVVGSDDNGEVGGTSGERYVKMDPSFVRNCPRDFRMPNTRNFYKTLGKDIENLEKIKDLPPNALRHSWFTYHLARDKSAATTAHEGGNSERMVKKVYALAAKRANQEAWWAL